VLQAGETGFIYATYLKAEGTSNPADVADYSVSVTGKGKGSYVVRRFPSTVRVETVSDKYSTEINMYVTITNDTNETVHTVGVPHLVGTKVANPSDYARVGDTIHYTVQVTNDGTARAHDVAVFDRFRAEGALNGVALVPGSWKVSGGDAAQTSKSFAPNFGASAEFVYAKSNVLEPGDTLTMEFDVVIVDAKSGDKIENVASFEDKHTDLVSTDELAEKTNGKPKHTPTSALALLWDKYPDMRNYIEEKYKSVLTPEYVFGE
jgi:uncharacterized repeat protein (TIGR01451 family)